MSQRHVDLEALAWNAMLERGLLPDFDAETIRQVEQIEGPAEESDPAIRDLRGLDWVSIDNDDSRDLDQLTVGEELGDGAIRVMVAVADVDALVRKGSPVDRHARHNTTSVYTGVRIFPMLPERLSTDLTSLNENQDRLAVVVSYVVLEDGSLGGWDIYRAKVRNRAKLAYKGVSAWLNGEGEMPEAMQALPGAERQLRLQDRAAERLRERREERGALDLETIEARPVMRDGEVAEMRYEPKNRAQELIEDFMIAANGVTAQFLEGRGYPSLRRVVRSPERWDRLERLAAEYGYRLPPEPNARALAAFLRKRHREDPLRFPDLSLAVVKMLGAGEYAVQKPGDEAIGHFGLAVRDYSHSTAPNRRYPDLITQRLIKAALAERRSPYTVYELEELAVHCTQQENAANKVERQMRKSAAALLLSERIGDSFDALVAGATSRGTWVRIFDPPAEGMLVSGRDSFDVGDRLRVKLTSVSVERGYIDFISLK
jgi:exoribonuclease-2